MTGDEARRFGRQIRLVDLGDEGQTKLSASRVDLASSGFARTIEETYLRGAGVGITDGADERLPLAPDLGLRHAAAREVAEGAYAALVKIRQILGNASE